MKNSASTFRAQTHWNVLLDLHIPPDAKTQVWRNVTRRAFVEYIPVPHEHEK
jgi:hypothetical protein